MCGLSEHISAMSLVMPRHDMHYCIVIMPSSNIPGTLTSDIACVLHRRLSDRCFRLMTRNDENMAGFL